VSNPTGLEPQPKRRIDNGTVQLGDRRVAVVDLFAAVLTRVGEEARRVAGSAAGSVVLTHPATWGRRRQQVLLDAARTARLGTPELVAEPVAAAWSFAHQGSQPVPVGSCVLVCDVDGGTFDASVLRRTPLGFEVVAVHGLPDGGGPEIDAAVTATRAALRDAGVVNPAVAGLILVGGDSRIPQAAALLQQALGIAPTVIGQSEQLVARGGLLAQPAPAPSAQPGPTARAAVQPPGRGRSKLITAVLVAVAVLAVGGAAVVLVKPRTGVNAAGGAGLPASGPTAGGPSTSAAPPTGASARTSTSASAPPGTRPGSSQTLTGHAGPVWGVAFSPDGRILATSGGDNTVRLWDATGHSQLGSPIAQPGRVLGLAFSPDGATLATANTDQTVRLWNVASRTQVATLTGHTAEVANVAFSPDGKTLASAGYDHTVRLWNLAQPAVPGTALTGHTDAVYVVAFSPDGATIASAGLDNTVHLWDVASRNPLGQPITTGGHVVAYCPDGKTLATADAPPNISTVGVRLWDVASHNQLADPISPPAPAHYLTFSPDGRTLATGGTDGAVLLWDVGSRRQLGAVLNGHTSAVNAMAFSPDGATLATTSDDATVRLWNVQNYGR